MRHRARRVTPPRAPRPAPPDPRRLGGGGASAADVAKVATDVTSCETVNAGYVGKDEIEKKRADGDTMITSDDGELGIQVTGDTSACEQEIKQRLNDLQ